MIDKTVAVIPARYGSSRFPGKPLALIAGKTMIRRVYERVSRVSEIEEVIVATDDERIFKEVQSFNGHAVMTGECSCGTERVYQAVKDLNYKIILNIQGDEPLIREEMIRDLLGAFTDTEVKMATLKKKIEKKSDMEDMNIVKVITDVYDNAIYFSRYPIPYNRDKAAVTCYRHIGVYGYRKEFLTSYVQMPESKLEKAEKLEQLRALENGYKIRVMETEYESLGVDLPEQIIQVEQMIETEKSEAEKKGSRHWKTE